MSVNTAKSNVVHFRQKSISRMNTEFFLVVVLSRGLTNIHI